MEIIKAYPGELINIGRKGENLARQVQIDLTEWVEKYGDGKAELLYQRPQDVVPYPVPIERQGNSILWTITNTDTAQAGRTGRAEIRYYADEVLVILEISYIMVENTLESPGELPDPPGQSWFDQMLEQAKRVNAPSLNAPILNEETGTWMIWSQVTERYENTNFPATGPRGEQGPDPDLRIKAVPVSDGTRLDFSYMRDGEGVGESLLIRDGRNGEDGLTPEIDISQEDTAEGSTVAIKVKTGNKQNIKFVQVKNGKDGADGAPGPEGQPGLPGENGVTPHIGSNGNWYVGATDTGVRATGPSGEPGAQGAPGSAGQPGKDGADGTTPHIGSNGNWHIGEIDTGTAATGPAGPAGSDATVTADNIKSALGYTPANADDIVQADFEENNPESPAFIQNRTHWKETEISAVLFEKSDLTSAAYDLPEAIGLEEGQRYDVTYIGTVSDHFYKTKPVPYVSDVDDTERGLILVLDDGNVRNQKTTGLPFAFVEYDAATVAVKGVHGFAIQQDGSTTASLTIGGHRTTWHKLERGYLPDDLGDVKSVNGARPDEAGNVSVDVGVKTINGKTPDEYGNVKIETGGGATVQADFGENDPTAAGYIRNRTHWMEKIGVEGEIIKTSVSYLAAGSKTVAGSIANGLEEGGRYTVTWRGVTYMCVCALHNGTAYIGNPQMMDDAAEASDYPFCICGNGEKYKIYSSSLGSIAVEVVGEPEIIYHKLDKAYLPDDIGGGDNMFFVHASVETEEDGTKKTIVDKSLADIDQAITDGKVVYARYVSDDVIMMPFVVRSEHGALFGACAGSNRVISVYYLIMYEYGGGKVGVVSVPTEGVDGKDGADGITPHIGDNGNWYLGEIDTGVAATGPAGPAGKDGKDGKDGADGADGQRGTGVLKVTTQPSSYTTAIGDYTPKYRIALATVISQSKKTEVLLGDIIQYSYYQYHVDYLDATYAYTSTTRVSMRGATGAAGATGPEGPQGPAGSDASVTAENIKSALGYTPADAADLAQLSNEKVAKSSIVQIAGQDGNLVMSQKAVTDLVNNLAEELDTANGLIRFTNLYNPSLQTTDTISPHYYVSGVPYSTTQFDNQYNATALIEIEPSTVYTIALIPEVYVSWEDENYNLPWGRASNGLFFYDANGNYISGHYNGNTFTSPANAKYIRFNYALTFGIALDVVNGRCVLVKGDTIPPSYVAYGDPLVIKDPNSVSEGSSQCGVYYQAVDGGIYVNARYSAENDICYYLCKKGPNSIFEFSKIGLVAMANPVSDVTTPTSWLVPSSGDWHAPYVVAAKSNVNGDNVSSHYFTGGNHSVTNGATGNPTGRTDNLKMYADGKALANGDTGYCNTVKLEWDNFVQAYNTSKADGSGREVLREHITMVFDGEKWNTETIIYPLEDITIETWYGLQFTSTNYAYVAYIGGETGLIYPKGEDSEAGNATTNAMRFFTPTDTAVIEIDTGYDLGTRKHAPNTAKAFFARGAYSKAYGTVMAGATLACGGAYAVRGSYTFKYEVQYTPAEPPAPPVESVLSLNRTQGTSWWSEDNYINPTNIYSVVIPSETPCGVADLTDTSITVTDNGSNRGVTFPFVLYTSSGVDKRGKSYVLSWDTGSNSSSRLFIMGNIGGMKQIDLKGGTATSATIEVSEDGKTLTVNGTAYTHTAEIGYIGFFFGAKSGKTVSYTNVTMEDVTA